MTKKLKWRLRIVTPAEAKKRSERAIKQWRNPEFRERSLARLKLTPDLVRYIRSSPARHTALAKELGVGISTITDVRKRRTWAWVE